MQIAALGVLTIAFSAYWLPKPQLDVRFILLAALMMVVSSRLSVQIPRVSTNVTVSDTFIFLVLLLYRGFAGVILAAIEGLFSGLRRISIDFLCISMILLQSLCNEGFASA